MTESPSKQSNWTAIEALADRCVMCGLCLPHCPTYRVHRKESESPRGRIALARALAGEQLGDRESALEPLDHCLGCLNCEGVCPAQVHYGDLISRTRQQLSAPTRSSRWSRWVRRLSGSPVAIALGSLAYRWWSAIGRPTAPLPRALARLAAGLPRPVAQQPSVVNAPRWLFSGCASSAIDQPVREAAAKLLSVLGLAVRAHPLTGCCGQLHRMAGDRDRASDLVSRLQRRLDRAGVDQLISVGSGCHGQLSRGLGQSRVVDLGQLLGQLALDRQGFRALPVSVHLHCPCSQRSEVGDTRTWSRLLQLIPQLRVIELPSGPSCCGAAGVHCVEQPETAASLRGELLAGLDPKVPILLTTNPGCALYLRAGLVEQGSQVRVAHPAELLAEQLLSERDP